MENATNNEINLSAINHAIHEKVKDVELVFSEKNQKTRRGYPVTLSNTNVKYLDSDRIVFQGLLTVANTRKGIGFIEYLYNPTDGGDINPFDGSLLPEDDNSAHFYRVSFSDKTLRCRRLNQLLLINRDNANELIGYIERFLNDKIEPESNQV